jgi:hypothetical protein
MHTLSEFEQLWKDKYLFLVFILVNNGLVTLRAMKRVTDPDVLNERISSICKGWRVHFFKARTSNFLEESPAHKRCVNLRSG